MSFLTFAATGNVVGRPINSALSGTCFLIPVEIMEVPFDSNIDGRWCSTPTRRGFFTSTLTTLSENVCEAAHQTRLPVGEWAAVAMVELIQCHCAAPCMLMDALSLSVQAYTLL